MEHKIEKVERKLKCTCKVQQKGRKKEQDPHDQENCERKTIIQFWISEEK